MKNLLTILVCTLVVACVTSPTGRRQLILLSDGEVNQMGVTAFSEMKQKEPRSSSGRVNDYVNCVANATLRGLPGANPAEWEVQVFDDDEQVNAFALPGGKIGVYTGLLKVAENQDQLATVIGHEIGHVIARHGNERMSQQTVASTGMQAAAILAGQPTQEKQLLLGLLGLGAQYGVLMPYGRAQESESDVIGLEIMARAGFDPRQSVTLWQNMARASGGKAPPEFMSTHPSNQTRIEQLSANMDSALELQREARASGQRPNCRK